MNENVTNKTPKRRSWIARLLVSALCILLASSLLFVGVAADVGVLSLVSTSSFPFLASGYTVSILDSDFFASVHNDYIYLYRDDILLHEYYIPTLVTGYVAPSTDYKIYSCAFDRERSVLYLLSQYDTSMRIITLVIRDFSITGAALASYSVYSADWYYPPAAASDGHLYILGWDGSLYHFFNGDFDLVKTFTETLKTDDDFLIRSGSCYCDGLLFFPGFKIIVDTNGNYVGRCPELPIFVADGLASYSSNNYIYSFDSSTNSFFASYQFFDFSYSGQYLGFDSGSSLTLLVHGSSSPYLTGLFTFPSSPPESSDETTTEPPPESSEESTVGGVIDLYSYDKLSDGSYQSAQIGTLDLTDATGLRVFLGMYLLGDNVWSDIKTPLTLLVYREDGSLDTYTYDYYAAGFAWGDGSPGSFTFPKFIGGFFDIPLSSSSELYFSSSAPGGTIWVQNNSVVLRQINLLSSDSYVELDNVSAEECVISVYDSPFDEDPESYVYTSGVLKYTLRKRNSSSSIPVSLEYGETGTVHGVMKYNGADFTVSSIILAPDPDLAPPIYDFESMDNALSEAYDDVSRQQYLENLLTSYIENAYGTVSYHPDTSGAFLGGVDLMGDIVDSSGGSTIITAFVNMWSIHPFFPAMVGLLGTFLIFSFFLRKA